MRLYYIQRQGKKILVGNRRFFFLLVSIIHTKSILTIFENEYKNINTSKLRQTRVGVLKKRVAFGLKIDALSAEIKIGYVSILTVMIMKMSSVCIGPNVVSKN